MDGVAEAWLIMNATGEAVVDKATVMQHTGLHPRDLHLLDPLSRASAILGRNRAIVFSLEHIKAIITTQEVFLQNPYSEDVIPVVEELGRRLANVNVDNLQPKATLPLELLVLEVSIEAVCSFLDARTTELETLSFSALHMYKLLSLKRVSNPYLYQVRKLKGRIRRLMTSALNVKAELEQLLDDDEGMSELLLTRKVELPALKYSSASQKNDDREVESILECYFMQINRTLFKLNELQAYIDDTEDHIKLQLYSHRNGLLKMELILKCGTLAIALYSGLVGAFGMNIPFSWREHHSYMFKWVVLAGAVLSMLVFLGSFSLSWL